MDRLVLINASVYAKGTGKLATLPKTVAYAGVSPWDVYSDLNHRYNTFSNMIADILRVYSIYDFSVFSLC